MLRDSVLCPESQHASALPLCTLVPRELQAGSSLPAAPKAGAHFPTSAAGTCALLTQLGDASAQAREAVRVSPGHPDRSILRGWPGAFPTSDTLPPGACLTGVGGKGMPTWGCVLPCSHEGEGQPHHATCMSNRSPASSETSTPGRCTASAADWDTGQMHSDTQAPTQQRK